MEERILVIHRNGIVTVVGPMTLDQAKKGQIEIINKMKKGTGNVVIDRPKSLESVLKELD
ncbi:MAG: hypothetical protein WCG45_01465 [bacterium]